MEIENTPLWDEANGILTGGATTTNYYWDVVIHYGENKDKDYTPLATIAVNNVRDYCGSFTDERTLTVIMGLGDYSRIIYPSRTTLEVTLSRIPLIEGTTEVDGNAPIQTERLAAILLDSDRSPTIGQGQESNDITALNLTQIVNVNFQIYDKSLEQIRALLTGGIYRSTNVQDLVKTALTNAAMSVEVDGKRIISGVDMVDADNKDEKGQIVITHGTKIIDLPDYVQNRYGIYNSGLGNYIQNNYWHIFTLYDTTEFSNTKKTLSIIILPKRKFASIERTFALKGDALTILVTGETGFRDPSGSLAISSGNGARFSDANVLFDAASTTADNKTKVKRNGNNSEFIANPATNGVNMAPVIPDRITANPFTAYTALAARQGGIFKVVWENSDSSLIYPGMPVKVAYVDGDAVNELYGVVHKAINVSHKLSPFGTTRFKHQTILSLFLNNQVTPIKS